MFKRGKYATTQKKILNLLSKYVPPIALLYFSLWFFGFIFNETILLLYMKGYKDMIEAFIGSDQVVLYVKFKYLV